MAFLKVTIEGRPEGGREYEFTGTRLTIGRAPENDVELDLQGVSRCHAVVVREDGRFSVIDQNSTNGTWYKGHRITTQALGFGDAFRIGTAVFHLIAGAARQETVQEDWSQLEDRSSGAGPRSAADVPLVRTPQPRSQKFVVRIIDESTGRAQGVDVEIPSSGLTIGRDRANLFHVPDPQMSRFHARITLNQGIFTLFDLKSSNGTWVGNARVDSHVLQPGDRFTLGSHTMEFGRAESAPGSADRVRSYANEPVRMIPPTEVASASQIAAERKRTRPQEAGSAPAAQQPRQQSWFPEPVRKPSSSQVMERRCPSCQEVVEAEAAFCGNCGGPVDQPAPAAVYAEPESSPNRPALSMADRPAAPSSVGAHVSVAAVTLVLSLIAIAAMVVITRDVSRLSVARVLVPVGAAMCFLYVYFGCALSAIALKTRTEPLWWAWVPVANILLCCRIAGLPFLWAILAFIPVINLVAAARIFMGIASARGKPSWVGLLILVPFVGLFLPLMLAAGRSGAPAAVSAALCPRCREALEPDAMFCGVCGYSRGR